MLRWRLLLGFVIVAALVGLCWLDYLARVPGVYLLPVGLVLVVLATSELLDMLAAGGMKPRKGMVYGGNILLFASCWLPAAWNWISLWIKLPEPTPNAFAGMAVIFAGCVFAVFLAEIARYEKPGGHLANLAASVFALAYVGMMFFFVAELRLTWGIGALASMIVAVKMGDIGAYAVGRLIGRHKMAPRLSPGKTIEGAVGAILFSCAGAWLSFHFLDWMMVFPAWKPANSIAGGWWVFGLCVGTAGLFGDLAESLIKRDVGWKDSSSWMPGFGGVLDILDSLLLAAPVAWLCWAWGIV
jgi:phosphatidate cytidylyltransferase